MTAISQLNGAVALAALADGDKLPVTDMSDTTESPNGTTKPVTALVVKNYVAGLLVKGDVGLANVDNTADASKPVSTAQATAIGLKQNTLVSGTNIKTVNGVSILGSGDLPVAGGGAGTAIAYSASIPLDGNKYMTPTPQDIVSATAFAVSGTPVIGGQCTLKLVSNGTITPTFTGMVQWGGSTGWTLAAGSINNVTIWFDGFTTYYNITPNGSAPLTLPVPTAATKTGNGPGSIAITMSAAPGATQPDVSKFTVTTTNGGAQTDTVTAAALSGTTLTLTTSRAATTGDTTTVLYDPTQGSLASRMVDVSGNLLFAWSNLAAAVLNFVGVLDGLGQTSTLALSINRKLRTGYTGPIIALNSSATLAGTSTDYFADGNGNVTGLPGGTMYLDKIYDQSGLGQHFTWPVAGSGGRGTLVAVTVGPDTRYKMRPDVNGSKYTNAAIPHEGTLFDAAGSHSFAMVTALSQGATAGGQGRFLFEPTNGGRITTSSAGSMIVAGDFTNIEPSYAMGAFAGLTTLRQWDKTRSGATQVLRIAGANQAAVTTGSGVQSSGSTNPTAAYIGSNSGASANANWDADIAEILWFPLVLTAPNLTAIRANQNAHWGTA